MLLPGKSMAESLMDLRFLSQPHIFKIKMPEG